MNIVMRKLGEISPYERNPRKNDGAVEYVANSIKEFGFKVPIVIDKDGVIVAGHTRVKAAERIGMEEVPCIIADDLTPEQVKAFRLVDNKVAEYAGWDFTLQEAELDDLGDFDMERFGFAEIDDVDLDDIFEKIETTGEENVKTFEIECPDCGRTIVVTKNGEIVR